MASSLIVPVISTGTLGMKRGVFRCKSKEAGIAGSECV
jgi:hypothetical protein